MSFSVASLKCPRGAVADGPMNKVLKTIAQKRNGSSAVERADLRFRIALPGQKIMKSISRILLASAFLALSFNAGLVNGQTVTNIIPHPAAMQPGGDPADNTC